MARLFALLAALLLLACTSAQACVLRLSVVNLPAPLNADGSSAPKGLDLELAETILTEAKCKLELQHSISRLRRDILFAEAKIDLILSASITPERQQIARFSIAYRQETIGLFVLPARLPQLRALRGLDDILAQRLSLLVPSTGWYGDLYAELQPKLAAKGLLPTFNTLIQGIHMLEARRADLIMGDVVGIFNTAQRGGIVLARLPVVIQRAPVHLMLNLISTSDAERQRIDNAINALEKRGVLKAIRQKYGDTD